MSDGDPVTRASARERSTAGARVRALRVLAVGAGQAVTVMLDGKRLEIGRAGHAAGPLALGDPEISRLHAVIEGGEIVDQGSRNGTFVDGRRVERAALAPGTVIRVGGTLMVHEDAEVPAPGKVTPPMPALIGQSLAMLGLKAEIALVAAHALPVLVLGETGAGKEVVAEEIHRLSGRTGRLVPVNCAAISSGLAESELFGHVAGAFTGAKGAADGLFAAADRGTLFLDEVGELPAELQPKLLRALAKGEVRAVGASDTRQVDVRVIAATLRDLDAGVEGGTFREDLLARLSGWTLRVPPLRARRADILALATAFLERRGSLALSVDAAEALLVHGWPSNVRELLQVVEAASVRAAGEAQLRCEHLPAAIAARVAREGTQAADSAPLDLLVPRDATPTREQLILVLTRTEGNVTQVAEYFDRHRAQIYRWAEKHGLDVDSFRKR